METLTKLIKTLVDNVADTDSTVSVQEKEKSLNVVVLVDKTKIPIVIGKEGKTAESIRALARGLKDTNKKIFIKFQPEK